MSKPKDARTFQVKEPLMKGKDIKDWQQRIKGLFKKMNLDCPIKPDGVYGHHTRTYSAALCQAMGLNATKAMASGVTPELRTKLRNGDLTAAEKKVRWSKARKQYRQKLRKQWSNNNVHPPVASILADSWGYHPGVHDGIDVICKPNAACFAMVRSRVIDVRASGWWGQSPSGDVSKGDGIVQLEVLENVGPFKKGMHIGYGHCEHARVKVGEIVEAGETIALAGLAVAWHIHLMVNNGKVDKRGIGNIDPRKCLDYAVKNG
jgi:murein DD-endopeptidase MepM/ murein hydrolase activator NlpD